MNPFFNLLHFCLYLSLLIILISGTEASTSHLNHHEKQHGNNKYDDSISLRPSSLFVFGDSYADTGNYRRSLGGSWLVPYGITFPGKPSGRFSDGRVLTDYLAKSLGLKSPVPYEWRKIAGEKKLRNGMNFAYGGSGVFDTLGTTLPNMTTQIDFLQNLIDASVYTNSDLKSSVVLVALSGNDYSTYVAKNGSIEGLQTFIPQVINQLSLNLRRIHQMGANKIVATSLQPLGCLPRNTAPTSYQRCNETLNMLVNYHNQLLRRAVEGLNNETKSTAVFSILDLYEPFTSLLEKKGNGQAGNSKFDSPLKPCCSGINGTYSCGSVDDKGKKMYQLCSDPKSYFFWDSSHPTEAGWREVFMSLKTALKQFLIYNRY